MESVIELCFDLLARYSRLIAISLCLDCHCTCPLRSNPPPRKTAFYHSALMTTSRSVHRTLTMIVAMPGFVKRVENKAGLRTRARPRMEMDAEARAEAFCGDLHVLAEKEEAPASLTAVEIEKILILSSYKQYTFEFQLWRRYA